jgi:hypothetical protein
MLPDDALLEIFDHYIVDSAEPDPIGFLEGINAWHTLVHVCQRWRNVVFGSPRRLNLRLFCTASTPVRKMLDVWPDLPIVIRQCNLPPGRMDNVFAALKHNDRVCEIEFQLGYYGKSELDELFAAMEGRFPALTDFRLDADQITTPDVPNSFLGGSASHLRSLSLNGTPFTGLPRLLLSATNLVSLTYTNIPPFGYISPETMATSLSAVTSLEYFDLGFPAYDQSHSYQKSRGSIPPIRTVFPALKVFRFKLANEYLEDFVAMIDAPLLCYMRVYFICQPVYVIPHLSQFISRTTKLKVAQTLSFPPDPITLPLPTQLSGQTNDRYYALEFLP